MAARNRSNVYDRISGGRWFNNNPAVIIGEGPTGCDSASCGDITGPGDCAPLTVNRRSTSGGVINKHDTGSFSSQFRDYICDYLRNPSNGSHLVVSGVPSNLEVATSAAARTNPSRPVSDVPVNILDVRAGVQRIKWAGDRLIDTVRRTGGRWLNYQFMVRPLVSDVVKMIYVNDQINRRVRAIDKLYDGNGIRRTVTHGVYSRSGTLNLSLQSAGTICNDTADVFTEVIRSCHIRWKPTTRCGLRPSPQMSRALAVQATHGMTIDLSTLWEIMPWSWLIDYFGNVGTYLSATRNIIPAQVTGVHPMTHTRTMIHTSGWDYGSGKTITGVRVFRETKTRDTSFVAPIAYFGFLNGNQMGILAALAASRA